MKKISNSLGMFNAIKGLGILLVILGHTANEYDLWNSVIPTIAKAIVLAIRFMCNGLMPAFLIMSGYGFKKRNFWDSSKRNTKMLLENYVIASVIIIILNPIIKYLFFKYWRGGVFETGQIAGGLILCLPENITIGSTTIFWCGPMWFLVALAIAYMLLQAVMNYCPQKWQLPVIVFVVVIGWLWAALGISVFCIPQGMIGTGYFYLGYRLKKDNYFAKDRRGAELLLVVIAMVFSFGGYLINNKFDDMAYGNWGFGILGVVADGILGVFLVYLLLCITQNNGRIANVLGNIGRYSILMLVVHTIELLVVPWYLYNDYFEDRMILGLGTEYVLRLVINVIGCYFLSKLIKQIHKKGRG